jgi:hypothetical protein
VEEVLDPDEEHVIRVVRRRAVDSSTSLIAPHTSSRPVTGLGGDLGAAMQDSK